MHAPHPPNTEHKTKRTCEEKSETSVPRRGGKGVYYPRERHATMGFRRNMSANKFSMGRGSSTEETPISPDLQG